MDGRSDRRTVRLSHVQLYHGTSHEEGERKGRKRERGGKGEEVKRDER